MQRVGRGHPYPAVGGALTQAYVSGGLRSQTLNVLFYEIGAEWPPPHHPPPGGGGRGPPPPGGGGGGGGGG